MVCILHILTLLIRARYMEPMVKNLEDFVKKFGDDGISEMNSIVSNHVIELYPQEETKFSYGGLVVKDGTLRLVFAKGSFASNVSDVSRDFSTALNNAAQSQGGKGWRTNMKARQSVREDYDPKVEAVRKAIADLTGIADIKLNPNWEENANKLADAPKVRDDWETRLGRFTLDYYDSLRQQLSRAGFKDDDLLCETIQEAVSKKEIKMRIVEKLTKSSAYNEVVLEDGVLVIQTIPEKWASNVSDTGSGILDIL